MARLKNKRVLLSGAGRGMGSAIASLFAREGASLTLVARTPGTLEKTASEIREAGGRVVFLAGDMADPAVARRAVSLCTETFGGLDAFVNLPGGNFRLLHSFDEIEDDLCARLFQNHVLTLFHGARCVAPEMRKQGGGVILSVGASIRTRLDGNIAYGTAKEAVIGMTRNLARELAGSNIRVNCLCPGLIREPCQAAQRLPRPTLARRGQPEDIAYAALFLASDESPWITGQTIAVDGGGEVFVGQERQFD